MVQAGVMDGVDMVIGTHLWSTMEFGTVGICPGPMMAAPDTFWITVLGKGGHAALPSLLPKCVAAPHTCCHKYKQARYYERFVAKKLHQRVCCFSAHFLQQLAEICIANGIPALTPFLTTQPASFSFQKHLPQHLTVLFTS